MVTILGDTYKPNVDDTRESPVLHLIDILKEQKINVRAFDPYEATQNGKIAISDSLKPAADTSDFQLLGVHHDEFKDLPFQTLGKLMRHKNFYDTRNFVSATLAEEAGFRYYLLGSK